MVVEDTTGLNTLICKGAVEEVLGLCTRVEVKGEVIEVLPEHDAKRRQIADDLNGQGFRVIALAYKQMPGATDEPTYAVKDESDLIRRLPGLPRPAQGHGCGGVEAAPPLSVDVKILTGDNEIVTAFICKEVGLPVEHLLLGSQMEAMSEVNWPKLPARPAFLPGSPRPTRNVSSARSRARAMWWDSWATASTTPRP